MARIFVIGESNDWSVVQPGSARYRLSSKDGITAEALHAPIGIYSVLHVGHAFSGGRHDDVDFRVVVRREN